MYLIGPCRYGFLDTHVSCEKPGKISLFLSQIKTRRREKEGKGGLQGLYQLIILHVMDLRLGIKQLHSEQYPKLCSSGYPGYISTNEKI